MLPFNLGLFHTVQSGFDQQHINFNYLTSFWIISSFDDSFVSVEFGYFLNFEKLG